MNADSRDQLLVFAASMSPDEIADLINAFQYSTRKIAFLEDRLTKLLVEIKTLSDMENLSPVKTSAHSSLYKLKKQAVAIGKEIEDYR